MGYRRILQRADEHFATVAREQAANLQCGRGCSFCCYGLFEIGEGDAGVIAEAVRSATPALRRKLIGNARRVMETTSHPNIRDIAEDEKEAFFDRTEATPCPALDDHGSCMIYENRPIVCRTFGLPLRDGDEYIGDICNLNFTEASEEEKQTAAWDLQNEDVADPDAQYTIPEAIVLAGRKR